MWARSRVVAMCQPDGQAGRRVVSLAAVQRSLEIIADADQAAGSRSGSGAFPGRPGDHRWRARLAVGLSGASIYCLGGVVFGIGSLYPILYQEHVMEGLCHSSSTDALLTNSTTCAETANPGQPCCMEQQLRYTLLTSIAFFTSDAAMLLFGEFADRAGPRWCFGIGATLVCLSLLMLALSPYVALAWTEALWFAAFFCVGFGGPGVFVGALFIGEAHPHLRAVVASVAAAMEDSSASVFVLFRAAYFGLGMGLDTIALLWLALSLLLSIATTVVLPSRAQIQQMRSITTIEAVQPLKLRSGALLLPSEQALAAATASPCARPPSVWREMFRTDTVLLLAFLSIANLKSSFYLSTFSDHMHELFSSASAEHLTVGLGIAFPLGGCLTSVGAAVLLQRLTRREDLYMAVALGFALVFFTVSFFSSLPLQWMGVLLFGCVRTLQWACYFHLNADRSRYSAKFTGRRLGYGNLVIGVVGNVPPYLLNMYVKGSIGDEESRYMAVHGALLLGLICCLPLPWYLQKTLRQRHVPSRVTGDGGSSSAEGSGTLAVCMRSIRCMLIRPPPWGRWWLSVQQWSLTPPATPNKDAKAETESGGDPESTNASEYSR